MDALTPRKTNLSLAALRLSWRYRKLCLKPLLRLTLILLALSLFAFAFDDRPLLAIFPFAAVWAFIATFARQLPLTDTPIPHRQAYKAALKRTPRILLNASPFLIIGAALLNLWLLLGLLGIDAIQLDYIFRAGGAVAQLLGAMIFILALSYAIFNFAQNFILAANGIALPAAPLANRGKRVRLFFHYFILMVPIYLLAMFLKSMVFASMETLEPVTVAHVAQFLFVLLLSITLRIVGLAIIAAFAYVAVRAFYQERPTALALYDKPPF